ncbi:MerR family DNA-binding transcriptional regulator [Microbacterium sp.]|uniref:MerR family DNA-binding transcriptional regulator n=1 Tax=Actinomycetes TaxID=1760 RepID=UPI0037C7ECAD
MEAMHTYLSIGEVAAKLGVAVSTVRNWDSDGKLRSVRTPGGHRRFLADQVDALLETDPEDAA